MRRPGPPPRPRNPPKNTPKSTLTTMKKNGLTKIWEVKRTPNRNDDKAFVSMQQTPSGKYKLVRFGSIASEKVRFDSPERRDNYRSRHSCDKNVAPWGTARRSSCDITWARNRAPRTVINCSNCR